VSGLNLINDFKTVSEFRDTISASIEGLKNKKTPLVITQQGRPAAVVLDPVSYHKLIDDYEAIVGVLQGLKDSREGRTISSDSLREKLIKNGKLDQESGE
jgi:antitoxin YefM